MQLPERDLNRQHAFDMLKLFIMYSNEEGNLSEEGFTALHEKFGDVNRDNRFDVFTQFTQLLEDRGISYKMDQFVGGLKP